MTRTPLIAGNWKMYKTGSEAISTMFYADGYLEIDELESLIEKGEKLLAEADK